MLRNVVKYPNSRHMICANVFSQLLNASVHTFTTLLDQYGIPYKSVLSGAKKHIKIGKTTVEIDSHQKQ